MIRRLPVLPTLIVLIAAAVMVRLGFWQLDRLHQKEALLESFAAAQRDPAVLADRELHLNGPRDGERLFYHRARFTCGITGISPTRRMISIPMMSSATTTAMSMSPFG